MLFHGISNNNPKAAGTASVKVSVSSASVNVGDTVSVTISVSGMEGGFFTLSVGYDSSILQLTSGTAVLSGGEGSYKYSFKAINPGTAYISTSGTDFIALTGDVLNVNHGSASVTVKAPQAAPAPAPTTPETKPNTDPAKPEDTKKPDETTEASNLSKDCTLKSLQITPGSLDPAFSSATTVYNTKVEGDVTEIYVTASANDSNASVSVSGNKGLKVGKNVIKVSVIAESGAVSVYTINVQVGEPVEEAVVTINDKDYTFETDASLLDVPTLFEETTVKYEKYTVPAYKYKSIVIVSLVDEYGDHTWFTIDEATGDCKRYVEYSPFFNRYFIFDKLPEGTEVPDGFKPEEFMLQGRTIHGYSNGTKDIYLVYAVNIGGAEGFYLYDKIEGGFIRYKTVAPVATESDVVETLSDVTSVVDEKASSNDGVSFATFVIVTAILGCLLLVAIVIIIVILSKNKANKVYESADKKVDKATDKPMQKTVEKVVEASKKDVVEEPKNNAVEKVVDEPVENTTDKSKKTTVEDVKEESKQENSEIVTEESSIDTVETDIENKPVEENASSEKKLTREQMNILKEMQNMKKASDNGEAAEEER